LGSTVAPEVSALEILGAIAEREARAELAADGARPLNCWLAYRSQDVCAFRVLTRDRVGTQWHERRHALLQAVPVRIATRHTERETVEVVRTRPADPTAEPLVRAREETDEAVRTVHAAVTGSSPIHTCVAFACEPGDAVVGVFATRIDPQAPVDGLVAGVCGVPAVIVVLAGAAARDETTRDIAAPGGKADLSDGTRRV